MRSRACALLLIVLGGAPAGAEVVERILAVVDGRPLLLSEARQQMELLGLEQSAAVETLIDERLMFREASRLSQDAVAPEQEQRALRSLIEKAPRLPEADLRRVARRQVAILKYVETRFRPQLRVDDAQVEQAYRAEYGGRADAPPLDAVAASLRERLLARALDARIEAWVRDLRAASEIRYNAP